MDEDLCTGNNEVTYKDEGREGWKDLGMDIQEEKKKVGKNMECPQDDKNERKWRKRRGEI